MKDNIILLPLTKEELEIQISACYALMFDSDSQEVIDKVGQLLGKLEELEGEL